ncbi:hypothetical protein Trydic_g18200 [Trypoxylus dichotomus]
MDENFRRLHDYISQDNYYEAKLYLEDLSTALEKELSESVIDNYVLNVFDESYGLLSFIQKTVDRRIYRNVISDAIKVCLDIIYTLLNNAIQKVEKHTPKIRDICLRILLTCNSTAHEKRKSLNVFLLIVEKTDYFPDGYPSREEVFGKLYCCYESASGEVLAFTIKIMGTMLKRYPYIMNDPYNLFKSILLKLKVNKTNKSDTPVRDCFFFLTEFLAVYSDVEVAEIYCCIKARMSLDIYRKSSHREGLNLLQKHIVLFKQHVYDDALFWYNKLNEWLEMGAENAKAAYFVLDVIYSSLSKSLAVDTSENRDLFMKFWDKFIEDIFHSNLHGYKLRLAIRGFGHFVSTSKVFLRNSQTNSAIYDFINKIEQTYLINFNSRPDDLDYLPEYIQSLSSTIQQIDTITEYELGILQQATVLVIKLFPQLANHHHNMVVVPMLTAYYHIRSCQTSMAMRYLLNVMREGVFYSCSQAVVTADVDYNQNITTYRNYVPFWQNFINKPKESYSFLSLDDDCAGEIQREIFDEFMATLLYLLEKLNLSTRLTDVCSTFSDPKVTVEAVKVNDFNIFVNVVDLYVDILKSTNKSLFKKWVQRFLNTAMVKSKKHPLVSGFYKLLAVGLKISNDLNYFGEKRLERDDIKLCYDTVKDSVINILSKVKLYKDDLKISCIKVILSTPISIIPDILTNVAPIMVSLFALGRSNLEFVEIGLDALEWWYNEIKQEDFDPFLREVLPHLDTYLCSKSISETFDAKAAKATKTQRAVGRRKIVTIGEGDLFKVQKRILAFIGNLSNDMCRSFVENSDTIGDSLFYGKQLHLKVELMFMNNFHVDLYLEKFILRIVELALYCSERKLRINACEVLHAIVLIFLGRTKQMSDTPKEDLRGVLKKLINALLSLGCDADVTVQKILRPLMLQLMHWYSSKFMKICSHTAIVVESVLDGVTQTNDSAVKDFSCLCIKEFVEWSIKQSTKSGLARDPINIQIILRKLRFFNSHSDPSKRFAASLIFNNIYTVLREETFIFQAYWMELLYYFVMNLSLIDEYDEYDSLAQVHASLNHLQRGFVEKSHIFNERDKDRRLPPNFADCLLIDVACWLLRQTGSSNRHCRVKCFDLFKNIAPLCGEGTLEEFIKYYQSKHGKDWMQELYFQNNSLKMDDSNIETLIKWMSDFHCLLDAIIFFEESGIDFPKESNSRELDDSFEIFHNALYLYNTKKLSSIDKERFNTLKNSIIKKYLTYSLKIGSLDRSEYWTLFTKMIFENNNLLLEEIHIQEINYFLSIMKNNLIEPFISSIQKYLEENPLENCHLDSIVPFKQRQILKGLLLLKNSCLSEKIPLENYLGNELQDICTKMIDCNRVAVNLQNTAREYCLLRIDLTIRNGDIQNLIDILSDATLIKSSQQKEDIEFGRYIFATFKPTIVQSLVANFEQFQNTLITNRNPNYLHFIEEIVQSLLVNKNLYDQETINTIIEKILINWIVFEECYDNNFNNRAKGLRLLENISRLLNDSCRINLEDMKGAYDWVMEMIDCLDSDNKFNLLSHKRFEYLNVCITALPLFLRNEGEDFIDNISDQLTKIEENTFMNLPNEQLIAATLFINKSFQAAILANSKYIFEFASKIFVLLQPTDDLDIDQYSRMFMKNANRKLQLGLLKLIYKVDNSKYTLDVYYRLTKDILINLLRYSDYHVFEAFFIENIAEILYQMKKKCTNHVEAAEQSRAFLLIRVLFSRIVISQDAGSEVSCPITKSAFPDTEDPKQLAKDVMLTTSQFLKDSAIIEDDTFRAWDRISKCECYNALISAVCNMYKEPIWYNLLFKREVKGCNMLWRNIVDESRDYTFSLDFDKIPKKRTNLVAIRSSYRAKRRQDVNQSLKYISSQNILYSTVSEDIVKYDFSRTILRSQEMDVASTGGGDNRVEMQVDIDDVELNSHECMRMLCGLFQHLHDEQIYDAHANKAPAFIECLRKDLEGENTSKNVKLFLIKALENKQDLFKPYARDLFAPIMKAIVDGVLGSNINYFITDVIVMLISWADGMENIEANQSTSELVHFLIKNINTDRSDVMKYHIDLIKFFVEQWKDHITVPKDYLLGRLRDLTKSKKVLPIVHVCSIFLANDLPPWNDMKIFVTKLLEIMAQDARDVYRSCAEAIGTALSYSRKHESESTLKNFTKYLVKSFKRNKKPNDKDLICLQAISKHYPEFADAFFTTLIHEFSKYRGQYKAICLKLFLNRFDALQENTDFPAIELVNLISDDNDDTKILGLEIVKKTLPIVYFSNSRARLIVKKEKFMVLLEKIARFLSSENNVCRAVTCEIFMEIYSDERFKAHEDIAALCKDVLLQGLVDRNSEIEEKLKEFWAKNIPVNTSEKFLFLLRDMYKASIENSYLGYYVNFLLNELILQPQYRKDIFEYNLEDCTYTDYRIKDNWRERHSTLAPLFAQTYRSQSTDDDAAISTSTLEADGIVFRATNYDMEFEPTQVPSLLEAERQDIMSRDVEDEEDGEDIEESDNSDDKIFKKPWPVKMKKIRFHSDHTRSVRNFALRKMEQNSKVERERKDSIKQKRQEVNIYRSYRKGDFPDIKLTVCDLIIPLKILVKHDSRIAKIFYTILFESITDKEEEDKENFINQILEGVNNIFMNSVLYDANVIGALLDVALKYKSELRFYPDTIARVASNSGLLWSGALLLEEYLTAGIEDDKEPPGKRRRGSLNDEEVNCAVKLADIYKELEEWDLVRAVFSHKVHSSEEVTKAIIEESCGNWRGAQNLYLDAIKEESSMEIRGFYHESYYKCFAELSDWGALAKSIKLSTSEDEYWKELWDENWHQQKILPWFMIAQLRNSLDSDDTRNSFVSDINDALADTNKLLYIKQNFSEEIAFLYLLTGDFDKVMYFLTNNIELFLSNWSNYSPLLTSLKMKKLLKMQNSLEMYNFVTKFNRFSSSNRSSILNDMCTNWLKVYNENLSSIVSSETRTIYRTQCLSILQAKFDKEYVSRRLDRVKFQLDMNLAKTALGMKNFHVCRNYLLKYNRHESESSKDGVNYSMVRANLLHLKATLLDSTVDRLNHTLEGWGILAKCLKYEVVAENLDLYLSINTHIYDFAQDVSDILLNNEAIINGTLKEQIDAIVDISPPYTSRKISDYGFNKLREALNDATEIIDDGKSDTSLKTMADAHCKLASFVSSDDSRKRELIAHVLSAMFYGSSEARYMFPCLLEVGDLGTTYKETFLNGVEKIPEWMFIRWIPQLLANLDTPNITVIFPIVERIAKTYPQAVMYPYRLSKQKYAFPDPIKSYGEQATARLDELLGDPFVDKFLSALSSVTLPASFIAFHMKQLRDACGVSVDFFKQKLDYLELLCREDVNYRSRDSLKGQVFKEIISQIKAKLLPLGKGQLNLNLLKQRMETLRREEKQHLESSSKSKRKAPISEDQKILKLSYYSPWLENFSDNEINLNLEIPGQYKGDKKPLLQYHVKICGFSSEVFKYSSLKSPLRLTIIGSDAKDYRFLVKFGEDLRLDQRIEQIFDVMNNIFNNDPVCREKRLSIRTYQVIPLDSTLGLIECVKDAETYRKFLQDTVPEFNAKTRKACQIYYETHYLKDSNSSIALMRHTAQSAIPIFKYLVKEYPVNMFGKAIRKLSVDSESYVALRNKFLTSHSVNSIANWILGIGDRHLDNSMVCLNSGQTFDIDFNYSFGLTVQILPTPEIVPFRLTPQLLELAQPLKEHGSIEETMVHVLSALRNNSKPLLSTMSVFITEPTLEWVEFLRHENQVARYNWKPQKKLDHARRKLEGASSVEIMVEELSDSTTLRKDVINTYIDIVKNRRPKSDKVQNLSVQDQVACLLDHATDEKVLVRLFQGWEAWV